jgi:hypothetical protein
MSVVAEEASSFKRLPALQDELRCLPNRWDPIAVYDELLGFPADESYCLPGPQLIRLCPREQQG